MRKKKQTYPHHKNVALPLFTRVSFFIHNLWITIVHNVNCLFLSVDNSENFYLLTCGKLFCFMIESENKNKEGELME